MEAFSQGTPIEILGATLFAFAVVHTFLVGKIRAFSHRFPKGSALESLFHFGSEIEVVFGLWGALLLILIGVSGGFSAVVEYQSRLHFTEPIFVFCIMVVAATKPILWLAQKLIQDVSGLFARLTRLPQVLVDVFTLMVRALGGEFDHRACGDDGDRTFAQPDAAQITSDFDVCGFGCALREHFN